MDNLEQPAGCSWTGNVSENPKKFKQRFDVYMSDSGADGKGAKQMLVSFYTW